MEKEAEEFYKAASPYKPTYYWLDVEEKTMKDMNAGVEAFQAKLQAFGCKKYWTLYRNLLHGRTQYLH